MQKQKRRRPGRLLGYNSSAQSDSTKENLSGWEVGDEIVGKFWQGELEKLQHWDHQIGTGKLRPRDWDPGVADYDWRFGSEGKTRGVIYKGER